VSRSACGLPVKGDVLGNIGRRWKGRNDCVVKFKESARWIRVNSQNEFVVSVVEIFNGIEYIIVQMLR
jgi:hypothetical protein